MKPQPTPAVRLLLAAALLTGCATVSSGAGGRVPIDWPEQRYGVESDDSSVAKQLLDRVLAAPSLEIEQAAALALLFHPTLAVHEAEVRVQDAGRIAASILPNPQLEVVVEELGAGPTDSSQVTVWVRQEIVVSSRLRMGQLTARENTEAARLDYLQAKLGVVAGAKAAFVKTWVAQERLTLLTDLRDAAAETLRAAEVRVAAGVAPELEQLRAGAEAERAEVALEAARLQLQAMQAGLLAAMGLSEGTVPLCSAPGVEAPALPALTELERALLEDNPSIRAAQRRVRAMDFDRKRAAAAALPNIEIGAAYHRPLIGDTNLWSVGIGIPLPFLNRNQGERARLQARGDQVSAELDAVRMGQLLAARQMHAQLRAARTTWGLADGRLVPLAREAFRRARDAYELGLADYLEVVDARRSLGSAQLQLLNAQGRTWLALARLEAIVGVPIGEDMVTP